MAGDKVVHSYDTKRVRSLEEGPVLAAVIHLHLGWVVDREGEVTLLCWRVSYRSRGERLRRYTLIHMPILWGVRGVTVLEADTDGLTQDHIVVSLLMSGWANLSKASPVVITSNLHTAHMTCTLHKKWLSCTSGDETKAPTHAFDIVIRSPRGAAFEKPGFVITLEVWKH